jgi:hypothetical protein
MRVEYDLKYWDILLFNIMHQFLSVPTQIIYVAGAAYLSPLVRPDTGLGASLLTAILIFVVLWGVQLLFVMWYLCFGKNRALFTRHIAQIRDDALCVETRFSKSYHYWPGLAKVISPPGFVAVYLNANNALVIPDRAFSSLPEREAFLSSLREKLHA